MSASVRWAVLGILFGLRIPSLVQPIAADQSLYTYIGIHILDGGAPYVDAWDQKPPGIHLLYALLWWIWPNERVVNAADLVAAGAVCWLLVVVGKRLATPWAGWVAAWVFALLANPAMHRLGGVFQRGQCETFIALAVTGALVLTTARSRRPAAMVAAGVLLGGAIWLKYNAAVFAVPLAVAIGMSRGPTRRVAAIGRDLSWVVGGAVTMGVAGLGWIAWRGALTDLWLATFDYNVAYSSSAFSGPGEFAQYVMTLPFRQARRELLWLTGLGGTLLAFAEPRTRRAALLGATWVAAALAAIAINGRDLPQYFVQATPALAFGAGIGAAAVALSKRRVLHATAAIILFVGLWRVGTEQPLVGVVRLGGLPGLLENVAFDLAYWRGRIERRAYLDRFGGQRVVDKFAALDVEELAQVLAARSAPGDHVLVFGFSPGALVKARRESASRFFWSLPVILEFAADRPGYGSAGLLDDLERTRPAVVVLQRNDWPEDSYTFFLGHPLLARWLSDGYRQIGDTGRYVIWQRVERAASTGSGP